MKTPVFDKDHKILGYLEHDEELARKRYFSMRPIPETGRFPSLADWNSRDPTVNLREEAHLLPRSDVVQFEWGSLNSSRSPHEMWCCPVLIVDSSNLLGRLNGFKWFAEEHGVRVAAAVSNG